MVREVCSTNNLLWRVIKVARAGDVGSFFTCATSCIGPVYGAHIYICMKLLGAPGRCNVTALGVGRAGAVAEFSRGICDVDARKPERSEVTT